MGFDLVAELWPRLVAILLVLWSVLSIVAARFNRFAAPDWCFRWLVIVALVRVLMPASALLNQQFLEMYIGPQVSAASQQIESGLAIFEGWSSADEMAAEDASLWQKAKSVPSVMASLAQKLRGSSAVIEATISGLLELCWLYVSLFVVQVILLPLTTLYLLYWVWHQLARPRSLV